MFAQFQTLIYRPTGQRACVKETPDKCAMHLGIPGKDPVPAYAIQFWVEKDGEIAADPHLFVAPKGLVEAHFRIPGPNEAPPYAGEPWPTSMSIGPETQRTISNMKCAPALTMCEED